MILLAFTLEAQAADICPKGLESLGDISSEGIDIGVMRSLFLEEKIGFDKDLLDTPVAAGAGEWSAKSRVVDCLFKCVECEKEYKTERYFLSHIKEKHPKLLNKRKPCFNRVGSLYECSVCKETFSNKSAVMNHAKVKHGKGFKCGKCGNSYTNNSGLWKHRKKGCSGTGSFVPDASSGVREAVSEEDIKILSSKRSDGYWHCYKTGCSRSFKHLRGLKEHIAVHNGKTYDCIICRKSFKYSSGLEYHFDREHNKIVHECRECGRGFASSCILKEHIDVVHNGKVYICTLCDHDSFKSSSGFRDHNKNKHLGLAKAKTKFLNKKENPAKRCRKGP